MKSFYLIITSIVVLCVVSSSCKPTPESYKRDFVKGCVNRYAKDSAVASTKGRILVEDYCNCLGDKLAEKLLNTEDWRQFNKSADTTLSSFQSSFDPCVETFSEQLSKLNK